MSYIVTDRMKRKAQLTMLCNDVNDKQLKKPTSSVDKMPRSSVISTRREKFSPSRRQLACTLHRQADQLHKNGDYEAALVLYHRAARLYPQNEAHSIATKKISTLILSSTSLSVKKVPSTAGGKKDKRTLAVSHSLPASKDIEKLPQKPENSNTNVKNMLRCYNMRKDLKGMIPAVGEMELIRSKMMLSQLNEIACRTLGLLKQSFNKNHFQDSIKIGDDLVQIISTGLEDQYCYQVAVHRYLALAHLSLRRHDRAVDHSAKMIYAAKRTDDINLRIRSFVVFGKVHLTFGHLTAAVKGWENLLKSLKEEVPKAWLLHEIGRSYYEMKNYLKALEISRRCYNWAEEGGSNKWMYHGKLLGGQALICLGRFAEGQEMLQCSINIAQLDDDCAMVCYIQNLMEMVSNTMRCQVKKVEKDCLTDIYAAGLDVNGGENVSNNFGYKLFTSRTQVIQRSQENENREDVINTRVVAVGVKDNDDSDAEDVGLVDKWKKYLKKRESLNVSSNQSEPVPSGLAIKPLGISKVRGDDELTQVKQRGELCSNLSNGVEESEGGDDGKGDESEDSQRTYGVEADLLYQCFVGNEESSDDDDK